MFAGVSTFSSTASPAAFAGDTLASHARIGVVQQFDTYRALNSRSDSLWAVEPSFEYSPDVARCITGSLQQSKLSAFEQTYFTAPKLSMVNMLTATPGTMPLIAALLLLSIMLCRRCRRRSPKASASAARSAAM